jgi:hypothetical protein
VRWIQLAKVLVDDQLPDGVSRQRAERELYERKVALYEPASSTRPAADRAPGGGRSHVVLDRL